ncbi:MAG: hypothetical protein HYR56_06240 [Acidobacteria bacterium]|nr:hypothetical protein [Acidobacteriota bacterium]MBI3427411.1 hypothetical protein [Acidobacteriota bacterium]
MPDGHVKHQQHILALAKVGIDDRKGWVMRQLAQSEGSIYNVLIASDAPRSSLRPITKQRGVVPNVFLDPPGQAFKQIAFVLVVGRPIDFGVRNRRTVHATSHKQEKDAPNAKQAFRSQAKAVESFCDFWQVEAVHERYRYCYALRAATGA